MLPFSRTLFEGELQSQGEFQGGYQGQTVSSEAQLVIGERRVTRGRTRGALEAARSPFLEKVICPNLWENVRLTSLMLLRTL